MQQLLALTPRQIIILAHVLSGGAKAALVAAVTL